MAMSWTKPEKPTLLKVFFADSISVLLIRKHFVHIFILRGGNKYPISTPRWLFSFGFSKMRCWIMFLAVNNPAASKI